MEMRVNLTSKVSLLNVLEGILRLVWSSIIGDQCNIDNVTHFKVPAERYGGHRGGGTWGIISPFYDRRRQSIVFATNKQILYNWLIIDSKLQWFFYSKWEIIRNILFCRLFSISLLLDFQVEISIKLLIGIIDWWI